MTSTIFISTIPFGEIDPEPIRLMKDAGLEFSINALGRKLQPDEVAGVYGDNAIIIAGTEPITREVMAACPNLKAICRVGIGLDGIDLTEARARDIAVSYTPDAPSAAVAELTVGLMVDLLRNISGADREIRGGTWQRRAGRRLSLCKVGIIGAGRIGGQVIRHLSGGFPGIEILGNDIEPNASLDGSVTWTDKETIYRECDVISLHVPLTPETENMIQTAELALFKPDAVLVNTARGGIVNERDLAQALRDGTLARAAFDVFSEEPYQGELTELENIVLTCHLGSMTQDCRARMEIEATQEAIRFVRGEAFHTPVPEAEYGLALKRIEKT